MKTITIRVMIVLMLATLANIHSVQASSIDNEVQSFFDIYAQFETNWKDAKIKKVDIIYGVDDNIIGSLNRIYNKDNVQQGYILKINGKGVVEAAFQNQDRFRDLNGKIYYVGPGRFMTKKDFDDFISSVNVSELNDSFDLLGSSGSGITYLGLGSAPYVTLTLPIPYNLTTSRIPDLSSKVSTNYSAYHLEKTITDFPDYMNWNPYPSYMNIPGADFADACVPVSSANLIAYYDNEYDDTFSSLDGANDDFSLLHNGIADDLINELEPYMGNCTDFDGTPITNPANCHGVLVETMVAGLEKYFNDNSLNDLILVEEDFENNFTVYQDLINSGNPTIIEIIGHPTYNKHAVSGIGYYIVNGGPPGVVIHDNWDDPTIPQELWLSLTTLQHFYFIYDNG